MKILIVDDDVLVRESLLTLMKLEGFSAEAAMDGIQALQLFQRRRFDVVILDMLMPGQDGVETLQQLKAMQPDIKIIAISSGGSTLPINYLETALLLGAQRAYPKPIKFPELLEGIREIERDKES